MSKQLFMESTAIPATKTAGDVTLELIKAGATQIATTYEEQRVVGLRWTMKVGDIDALFEMPARIDPIFKILKSRARKTWLSDKDLAFIKSKAERVAWRQLFRWIQAQNAMLETRMVQPMEVFAAYWIPPGQTKTMFESMMTQQFKALPAPEPK